MVPLRWKMLAVGGCLAVWGCEKVPPVEPPPVIEREYRAARVVDQIREGDLVSVLSPESTREGLADGKERMTLRVEPWLVREMKSVDPFDDPRVSLQKVLKHVGIAFVEGTSLHYDEASWVLASVNLPEQNDLISSYLGGMHVCSSVRLHVYAEIFEVSDSFAAGILESAAREADHTPERKAVLSAVEQGRGRRVESASLSGLSGQRSRVAAEGGAVAENGTGDEKAGTASRPTREEKEQAGLWLEVDPVLGGDGMAIDLNLRLVHSQPAPEGAGDGGLVSRMVENQVSVIDGRWTLIASWSHGPDRVQLVFMSASVQRLDYVQPVVRTGAEPENAKE